MPKCQIYYIIYQVFFIMLKVNYTNKNFILSIVKKILGIQNISFLYLKIYLELLHFCYIFS